MLASNTTHCKYFFKIGFEKEIEFSLIIEVDENITKYKKIQSLNRIEKLSGLLEKLHGNVIHVSDELRYLKNREDQFRFTSDSISHRLFYINIIQVFLIIIIATWQLINLKGFFAKKKLI
jgi:hypothetical protein